MMKCLRKKLVTALIAALSITACAATQPTMNNKSEKNKTAPVPNDRYKGIGITELYKAGSITPITGLLCYIDDRPLSCSPIVTFRGRDHSSYPGQLPLPKKIRMIWHEKPDGFFEDKDIPYDTLVDGKSPYNGGKVLGDYTVPFAERLPDEVLDAVRAGKGGLRLKIRLHEKGVLIGWDLEGAPYPTKYIDSDGDFYHTRFSMAGGDFQEAWIYNGIAVKKGWYIHPITKERIETDF
jgi:hypothetical protein